MKSSKELIKQKLIDKIKAYFINNPKAKFNYKQIAKKLPEIEEKNKKYVNGLLYQLAKENFIVEVYQGKYVLNPIEKEKRSGIGPIITGKVDMKQPVRLI